MPSQWTTPAPAPADLLFELADLPPFIVQALYRRGLSSAMAIRTFLSLDDPKAGDPFAMPGMDLAVARVQRAVAVGEPIAVYADFDVDGVSSAVVLMQTLESMGAQPQVYIPHRVDEGYGLNGPAVTRLAESGVKLMITADCGTSSINDITTAGKLGMDVIVTDHHQVHSALPPALAVLNPRRNDSSYPYHDLAGVGVAFRLAQALLPQSDLSNLIDLAALGTVVDVAPLQGENRVFARQGLALMRRAPRPGLKALMDVARVAPATVTAGVLGYVRAAAQRSRPPRHRQGEL